MKIHSVSSLNLRSNKNSGCECNAKEKLPIDCCTCNEIKYLGDQSCAMTRIRYGTQEVEKELVFCDSCTDVFVDLIRFGKHVIRGAEFWRRKSFTRRMNAIHEEMYCFSCRNSADSHIFVKYLDEHNRNNSLRICANCAGYYLELMDDVDLNGFDFPFYDHEGDMVIHAGGRSYDS